MKRLFGPVAATLSLTVLAPYAAAAQPAPSAQGDEAAKLAEAHAIIGVMFPPATRQQMMDKLLADMTAPMRQSLPMEGITDPGLKKIFRDYMDQTFGQMHAMIDRHLPDMTEAMAVAYTHQFSLAELKDIHAFALTPSGNDYFSHAMAMASDPAMKNVMVNMMVEAQQMSRETIGPFKDKITAYVKAHPDAAKQLEALGQSQTKAK